MRYRDLGLTKSTYYKVDASGKIRYTNGRLSLKNETSDSGSCKLW